MALIGSMTFFSNAPKTLGALLKPGFVRLQVSSYVASRNGWARAGYAQILSKAPTGVYLPFERSRVVSFPGIVLDLNDYPEFLKLQFKPVIWLKDLRVHVYQDSVQVPIVVYTP